MHTNIQYINIQYIKRALIKILSLLEFVYPDMRAMAKSLLPAFLQYSLVCVSNLSLLSIPKPYSDFSFKFTVTETHYCDLLIKMSAKNE